MWLQRERSGLVALGYIVGAGDIFQEGLPFLNMNAWQAQILFLLIFGPFVYLGTHFVGRFNVFFMLGLGLTYLAFVYLGFSYVRPGTAIEIELG